ncbi:hypothetical protein HGRIS_010959 [Hohenbuehelia grisea]|uniref:Uncharacterized protein n=1 Tax=Hohenbuehelia grisea TaxID=104357 RepID=A0ABR3IYQ6_9AGAR
MISSSLQALGAIPVGKFLSAPSSGPESLDLALHIQDIGPNSDGGPESPVQPTKSPELAKSEPTATSVPPANPITQIFELCQRVFGTTAGSMKFEFVEDSGPDSLQCIFTIQRPDGTRRLFRSDPSYSMARKNEAKTQAASIAMEMGAVEFIITGDHEGSLTSKGILAPLHKLDQLPSIAPDRSTQDDVSIQTIEECCREWRAGIIMPYWVPLSEGKGADKYGAALRIRLSPHCSRVFSTPIAYDTIGEAKKACANMALAEDVLEFIKYGNGQISPTVADEPELEGRNNSFMPTQAISLQAFYDTLPQPFPQPELVIGRTASGINGPGWLNSVIQASRGTRLVPQFIYTTDPAIGLTGCLLRLERPEECKSYLVDPLFSKRADAKSAVCLLAISQGIGAYIRTVTEEVQNKISPRMRRLANERIFPLFNAESLKIRPENYPVYEFERVQGAFGCTLKLTFQEPDGVREYVVPAAYATKADAKVAVAWTAAEDGAAELLRFRGQSPPVGYICFATHLSEDSGEMPRFAWKRKYFDGGDSSGPANKMFKSAVGDALSPTFTNGNSTNGSHNISKWSSDEPFASGSSRPGSTGYAALNGGRPVGWNRAGPSNAGNFRGNANFGSRGGFSPYTAGARRGFGGGPGSHFWGAASYPPAPSSSPYNPIPANATPPQWLAATAAVNPLVFNNANAPASAPVANYHPSPHLPPQSPVGTPGTSIPTASGGNLGNSSSPTHAHIAYPPSPFSAPPAAAAFPHPLPPFPPQPVSHTSPSLKFPVLPFAHARPPFPPPLFIPPVASVPPVTASPSTPTSQGAGSHADAQKADQPSTSPSIQDLRRAILMKAKKFADAAGVSKSLPTTKSTKYSASSDSDDEPELIVSKVKKPKAKSTDYMVALLAYCTDENVAPPDFHDEAVEGEGGKQVFRVWAIMGDDHLELAGRYASLAEGKNRLAKQILAHVRKTRTAGI